jgi:HEAT repeat protein
MTDVDRQREHDVRRLRSLLDTLVRSRALPSDEQEIALEMVIDEVGSHDRSTLVSRLREAAGTAAGRLQASICILCHFVDAPSAESAIVELFDQMPWRERHYILQLVGNGKIAPLTSRLPSVILNPAEEELCRDAAILAAGRLRSRSCLPLILKLADERRSWDAVTWALMCYASAEVETALEERFGNLPNGHERVVAAWGLAKLGNEEAVAYLAQELLSPRDAEFRAAQALADIFGLPFEWSAEGVAAVRKWWRRRNAK